MKKFTTILFIFSSLFLRAQTPVPFSSLSIYNGSSLDSVRIVGLLKSGNAWTNRTFYGIDFIKDRVAYGDTSSMLSHYLLSANAVDLYQPLGSYATVSQLSTKLNLSDSGAMLSPYLVKANAAVIYQPAGSYATVAQNAFKLNISDTAALVSPYLIKANAAVIYQPIGSYATNSQVALKMNYTDTSTLSNRILLKLDKSDSAIASRVTNQAGYINTLNSTTEKYSDTSTLSNRINLKLDKADSVLANRITGQAGYISTLNANTEKYTDTITLSNRILLKLDKADSVLANRITLQSGYITTLSGSTEKYTDTVTLSNRILLKLDKSDSTIANRVTTQAGYISTLSTGLAGKQATLVSGTNIRTINGNTLLGSTDLVISAGSSIVYPYTTLKYYNGYGNFVALNTDSIGVEGTNKWFTNARVLTAPITGFTSGAGALAGTDNILQAIQKLDGNTSANTTSISGKQPQLSGTGFVKASGTTISYDASTYLTANQSISFAPSGGDVAGSTSGATTLAPTLTVNSNAITNAKLAQMATLTIKGNNTVSTANALDLTAAQVKILLAIAESDVTNLTSDLSGKLTNPLTTLGDIIYENATPAPARLAGNTTTTKQYLTQTGNGSVSAGPIWNSIQVADVPTLNQSTTGTASNITGVLTAGSFPAMLGDVTNTAGSLTNAIITNGVTNAKFRQSAGVSVVGNSTASTANVADIAASADGQVLARSGGALSFIKYGGVSSISAVSSGLNTTETDIVSYTIPANTLVVGTTFKIIVYGTCSSTVANASNLRVRIGTAGSNADAIAAVVTPTAAASGTSIPFQAMFTVTIRTTGSGGTCAGNGALNNNGVTGISASADVIGTPTAAIAVNTTVQNIIHLMYVSAASTTTSTFQIATIELTKM